MSAVGIFRSQIRWHDLEKTWDSFSLHWWVFKLRIGGMKLENHLWLNVWSIWDMWQDFSHKSHINQRKHFSLFEYRSDWRFDQPFKLFLPISWSQSSITHSQNVIVDELIAWSLTLSTISWWLWQARTLFMLRYLTMIIWCLVGPREKHTENCVLLNE
jgi:hypothetical protein